MNVVTELDAKILDAIGEEEMDEDVELATNFESKVIVEVSAIEEKLKPKKHFNIPSEIKDVRAVAEKSLLKCFTIQTLGDPKH